MMETYEFTRAKIAAERSERHALLLGFSAWAAAGAISGATIFALLWFLPFGFGSSLVWVGATVTGGLAILVRYVMHLCRKLR